MYTAIHITEQPLIQVHAGGNYVAVHLISDETTVTLYLPSAEAVERLATDMMRAKDAIKEKS